MYNINEIDQSTVYFVGEKRQAIPFEKKIGLIGSSGEPIELRATFDDGAMVNAIDTTVFDTVKGKLSETQPSLKVLRMANGALMPSEGLWSGGVVVDGAQTEGDFEIFPSGGAWQALFGKPILQTFKATHEYVNDTIIIKSTTPNLLTSTTTIQNDNIGKPTAIEQLQESATTIVQAVTENPKTEDLQEARIVIVPPDELETKTLTEANTFVLQQIEEALDDAAPGTQQPEILVDTDTSIFTRATKPHKPERVAEILRHIEIGSDLSPAERVSVEQTISEFADIYALSVSEVEHIPGASHKLNIPEGVQFNTRIRQQSLSPPKAAYFSKALDVMLEAGIVEPIEAKNVKCVSPITLTAKSHTAGGMTLEELHQRLNKQCEQIGKHAPFAGHEDSPLTNHPVEVNTEPEPQKFRVCTNYRKLNEVTQVLQMPQGDIRTKQQAVSGHRWISLFDFAAGFYAVEVAQESRPYTAFYVEGRGYFAYCRMPFGLTGAPSCFNEVTAKALHGLVGTTLQLFVDDSAMAGDIFADKLKNIRDFFTRCREQHLSLSPQKTKLFMSEVVFAGERVGTNGIRGDMTKLTAVVNWQTPATIQNLEAFLGLTGYFRPLIKNYSLLEKPLKDLANSLVVPPGAGKRAYQAAARAHHLHNQWTSEHDRAFVVLKIALTTAPVVKGPRYDGSPFIVTTDGCKDGFAAILSQRFEWVDKGGKTHLRLHPIAFASKRTSDAESRYLSYVLEFAAVKFGLDKFSNVTAGYPIEIETDCKALKDTIINNKLNATHARWLDGIMGHHITDCRHRPGRENQAADGISRQFTDMPRIQGDGSDWTVNPGWEANMGLTYDIWTTQIDSEQAALRARFIDEPIFLDVIDAMNNIDQGKRVRDKRRARHRMLGYQIEGGRLYRIGDGKSTRARPRLECVTQKEAIELARVEHQERGHFGRDLIKISLLDRICSPKLDKSIMTAIVECGRCKGFGGTHLAALLEPITRRHPWELMVGDYLSMPIGKGGFHTIGLYMDVYSQKIFGHKFTTYGSTATTIKSLDRIRQTYRMPEVFMADGGSHFAGAAVEEWCHEHGSRYQQVTAYSPWVNGLLEGTNGKLLSRLKRLCAPDLGEDGWAAINKFEDLPASWPDHFDTAIEHLNARILPAYKFSPNELCLGIVVNTPMTPVTISDGELAESSIAIQNQYVAQQEIDAYSHIVEHANKRKIKFDKMVLASRDGVVEYAKGDLVQIRDSKLDFTVATEAKLLPRWGTPHRVVDRIRNAYRLQTIQGLPIAGTVSARRLRRFTPRPGTMLAREQIEIEANRESMPNEPMEGLDIEEEDGDRDEGEVEDVDLGEHDFDGD